MRYTFFDALPLNQSAAALVVAAIEAPYPKSVADLARAAGISRYAAMRAAEQLRNTGILTSADGRTLLFDDDHALAPTLRRLAWEFSGTVSADRSHLRGDTSAAAMVTWRTPEAARSRAHAQRDRLIRYRDVIPASLLTTTDTGDALGPDLVTVRRLLDWAADEFEALGVFEATGQRVYSNWRNERLRDVVHQTLNFGNALAEIDTNELPDQGAEPAASVNVSSTWWARATYLVSAEAYDVARVLRILSTAIREGRRIHDAREKALSGLWELRDMPKGELRDRVLAKAVEAAARADAIFSDTTVRPHYHHLGGLPGPRDVGTAGDQILSVQLRARGFALSQKVAQMAAEPGFIAWAQANPSEAEAFPLAPEIPEYEPSETEAE